MHAQILMNVKLVTIVLKCALTLLVLMTALVMKDIKWKEMNALVSPNYYVHTYMIKMYKHITCTVYTPGC